MPFLSIYKKHLNLTHTQTYSLFFLRCVCTRLPGHKSFSGMDECLQPIHHPPYPPPLPLFLYQPAVTLTTDGPLSLSFLFFPPPQKSFSCHFSFFSLPSALLALLVRLTMCMFVSVHAHIVTSPSPLQPPIVQTYLPLFLSCPPFLLAPLHVPLHLSLSLLCTVGTRVAPSEWAVKRPYKKPQHGKERVMMKFNCSSWCTWGLALCVCGYMTMCVSCMYVCVR